MAIVNENKFQRTTKLEYSISNFEKLYAWNGGRNGLFLYFEVK